jgi:hypothetical protein
LRYRKTGKSSERRFEIKLGDLVEAISGYWTVKVILEAVVLDKSARNGAR